MGVGSKSGSILLEATVVILMATLVCCLLWEVARRVLLETVLRHAACYYGRLHWLNCSPVQATRRTKAELERVLGRLGGEVHRHSRWKVERVGRVVFARVYYRYSSWLRFQQWAANPDWWKHHFEITHVCSFR